MLVRAPSASLACIPMHQCIRNYCICWVPLEEVDRSDIHGVNQVSWFMAVCIRWLCGCRSIDGFHCVCLSMSSVRYSLSDHLMLIQHQHLHLFVVTPLLLFTHRVATLVVPQIVHIEIDSHWNASHSVTITSALPIRSYSSRFIFPFFSSLSLS